MLAGILLAVAPGCQEYQVRDNPDNTVSGPDIEVTPLSLSIGPTAEAEAIGSFTIRNVGTAGLDVGDLTLAFGQEAFTILTPGGFEVPPDGEQLVDVAFTPIEPVVYGQVDIASDDPDEPVVKVDLEGLGEVPALEIRPGSHVFPTLCEDSVVLTLENVGVADLDITQMTYDVPSADLSLVSELVLPMTLAPAETAQVTVRYQPLSMSPVLGVLDVYSNDPRGVRSADQSSEASSGSVTERWEVEANPQIDVLFAIDKSGSMIDDARRLGQAFGDFIAEVGNITSDWQIGVVTRDNGCFNNGIITSATPNYEDVFLDAVSGQIFSDPDLTEALLAMVDVSLQETGPSGCNAGFRRPNSLLHVVTVSDEPEQSGQTYDYWLNRWRSQMSDPNLLVVSAIVDATGSCGGDASGYVEAANATGGLVLDLCTRAWSSFATQLGSASAQGLLTFLLSSLPDPSTIVVSVDGTSYTGGWHYDPVRNAVVVDVELPEGAVVEVTYTSIGC